MEEGKRINFVFLFDLNKELVHLSEADAFLEKIWCYKRGALGRFFVILTSLCAPLNFS